MSNEVVDALSYALRGAVPSESELVVILDLEAGREIHRGVFLELQPEAVSIMLGDRPMWVDRSRIYMARVIEKA